MAVLVVVDAAGIEFVAAVMFVVVVGAAATAVMAAVDVVMHAGFLNYCLLIILFHHRYLRFEWN